MMGPFARRRIEVHPRDPGAGIAQPDEMLELLRAQAPQALCRLAANDAGIRYSLFVTAVMTPHRGRRVMHREGDRALGTTWHVAARGTLDERREPAAIEQQDDLLAALQSTRDGGIECLAPRNHSWRGGGLRRRDPRRASQIHELHARQPVRPHAIRERDGDNPLVTKGLQRW